MPEVIFPGPDGRLEGRYHPQKNKDAPIAIILHPHPLYGGTMNNKVVYNLHYAFHRIGFTCLRFNFRGVGRSQGEYDQGIGELSDAAAALDYLQSLNANAKNCWVAGFSFGAWIGMQLLMRRPGDRRLRLGGAAGQPVRLLLPRPLPLLGPDHLAAPPTAWCRPPTSPASPTSSSSRRASPSPTRPSRAPATSSTPAWTR